MRRKLTGALVALALSALSAEFAARVFYATALPRMERHRAGLAATELIADGRTRARREIRSHPYMLYVNEPGFEALGFKQTNSLGYRNPEFPIAKPEGVTRVLALGGSTTFMYPYIPDPSECWTSLLERRLNEAFPDRRFEVVNAGLPYATSAELLAGYTFRHRYLDADFVVLHGGENDAMPLLYSGYDPEYTHFRASSSPGQRPYERTLLRSRLVRLVYVLWLGNMETVYRAQPGSSASIDRGQALLNASKTAPEGLRRNLDLLAREIKADGAGCALIIFPRPSREHFAKARAELKGLEPAFETAHAKNELVLRDIARAHGLPVIDLNTGVFADEHFQDNCHLTGAGERLKAEILFKNLYNIFSTEGTR